MSSVLWEKVFVYGSSMVQYGFSTEGCWIALLADRLQRKCDVINRGFSGYNTRMCKIMLPRLVNKEDSKSVAAFIIYLGGNDSSKPELCPSLHIPVDEYQDNLVAMVDHLVSVGISREKIILIGPSPCNEERWKEECVIKGFTFAKDNAFIAGYSLACRSAAVKSGVEFVELYETMMRTENWQSLFFDGLHFSQKGSNLLDKLLWPAVEKRTASLLIKMPDWLEIDAEHPENSLL